MPDWDMNGDTTRTGYEAEIATLRARIAELEARAPVVKITEVMAVEALKARCWRRQCRDAGDGGCPCKGGCEEPWAEDNPEDVRDMIVALTAALAVAVRGDGGSANGAIQMDEVKLVDTHPLYTGNLRYQMLEWTEAEHAIHNAMYAVERAGGSLHLTNATMLLSQARQAVAQHVLSLPSAPSKGEATP